MVVESLKSAQFFLRTHMALKFQAPQCTSYDSRGSSKTGVGMRLVPRTHVCVFTTLNSRIRPRDLRMALQAEYEIFLILCWEDHVNRGTKTVGHQCAYKPVRMQVVLFNIFVTFSNLTILSNVALYGPKIYLLLSSHHCPILSLSAHK